MKTILSTTEAKQLGRQLGRIEDAKLQAFINEVEMTIIRKRLGGELYIQLATATEYDGDLDILVNGGVYTFNDEQDYLVGLKLAITYFVYAQNVLEGDFESTRYGMRIKDDDYSQAITQKDRAAIAGSATDIAEKYLQECLEFCKMKEINQKGSHGMDLTAGCIINKIKID